MNQGVKNGSEIFWLFDTWNIWGSHLCFKKWKGKNFWKYFELCTPANIDTNKEIKNELMYFRFFVKRKEITHKVAYVFRTQQDKDFELFAPDY